MSFDRWQTIRLGEIADVQTGPFGSQLHVSDYNEEGIPVIMPVNISNEKVSVEKIVRVSPDMVNSLRKHKVLAGDIVFSRRGDVERHAFIRDENVGWLCGTGCLKVSVNKDINPRFISYQLLLFEKKTWLRNHAVGTTMPNLNTTILSSLPIELPDRVTQDRIASVLSSIDEKIELNRQTNRTLEVIAQALFKEWFVDFNFPGAAGEMQESELSEIPKGWKVGKLGDVCDLVYGKALKAENRVYGDYPVVGSSGIVDFHNEYIVSAPGIVIGRKGTIGEVTLLHKNFYPIDTTFYIRDKLGVNDLIFHYFLLQEQDFKKIASDSAVPGLNRNHAMENKVVIPDKFIVEKFHQATKAIFEAINEIEQQTETLTQLRDSLLPKLMKGEINLNLQTA